MQSLSVRLLSHMTVPRPAPPHATSHSRTAAMRPVLLRCLLRQKKEQAEEIKTVDETTERNKPHLFSAGSTTAMEKGTEVLENK